MPLLTSPTVNKSCCFNDDIQCMAAGSVSYRLIAASHGEKQVKDQTIVILGAVFSRLWYCQNKLLHK